MGQRPEPLPGGPADGRVPLSVIAREWTRIGCIGFGGPPAHISLLRKLCVDQRGWLSADEFEDGVATTDLLPGPASTQLTIFCAWRLAGPAGAIVGGVCFIVPGLIMILALSALFLAAHPPLWVEGAAAGAGRGRPSRRCPSRLQPCPGQLAPRHRPPVGGRPTARPVAECPCAPAGQATVAGQPPPAAAEAGRPPPIRPAGPPSAGSPSWPPAP